MAAMRGGFSHGRMTGVKLSSPCADNPVPALPASFAFQANSAPRERPGFLFGAYFSLMRRRWMTAKLPNIARMYF
jgi:hypothetical protein